MTAKKTPDKKTPAQRTSRTRKPAKPRAASQGTAGERRGSKRGVVIGAAALGGGALLAGLAAVAALLLGGRTARPSASASGDAEHVPTDLMGDHHPGPDERAVDAFRPDPTAAVPDSEREALRPATGTGPTLVKGQADELVRPKPTEEAQR